MGMDHDRLVAIKSGGQSLATLTSFCRELAKKGITDDFSDDDEIINKPYCSDDENDAANSALHHPFAVNQSRPIPNPLLMGLSREGVTAETLTPQARIAARSHRMIEYPVSSGNAHRVKVGQNRKLTLRRKLGCFLVGKFYLPPEAPLKVATACLLFSCNILF